MTQHRSRNLTWLSAYLLSAVLGFALATSSGGCSGSPCTARAGSGGRPSSSVECPSGTLCYQGACVRACSAGAEGSESCASDGECEDSARPNCVAGKCSSCESGEICLPGLGLCGSISAPDPDAGPRDGGRIEGSSPLDGGAIDGSILTRDSGVDVPIGIPPTHLGLVDIAEVTDAIRNVRTASLSVELLDVGGLDRVESTTVADPVSIKSGRCEVRTHDRYPNGAPRPADLGPVSIEPVMSSPGLDQDYRATFAGGTYAVAPPLGQPLLIPSTPGNPTNLYVFGTGAEGITAGPWPGEPRPTLHVPLELMPAPETIALLSSPIDADAIPGGALILRWNRVSALTFRGVRLVVRIEGPTWDLICDSDEEPGLIRVPGTVLELFRSQPGLAPDTTLDLVFERQFSQQLDVAPARPGEQRIELTVRIRSAFVGRIRL